MAKYKDADELLKRLNACKYPAEKSTMRQATYNAAISDACRIVDAIPAVDIPRWIPVKMRPMDSEEREYWEEHTGFTLTDDMAQTFDCPMPNDGQRIWVQTKNGFVFDDVCDADCDGIGLEGNGDWDDIIAWMPMNVPEPYKEGEQNG